MTRAEFIREASLGGPGLTGYAYQADTWCVDCGLWIIRHIAKDVAPRLSGTDDPEFQDSDTVPQPMFFEPCDYCAECGALDDGDEETDEDEEED